MIPMFSARNVRLKIGDQSLRCRTSGQHSHHSERADSTAGKVIGPIICSVPALAEDEQDQSGDDRNKRSADDGPFRSRQQNGKELGQRSAD